MSPVAYADIEMVNFDSDRGESLWSGRFLSADELIYNFGAGWKEELNWNDSDHMDFLIGRPVQLLMNKHREVIKVFVDTCGWQYNTGRWVIPLETLLAIGPLSHSHSSPISSIIAEDRPVPRFNGKRRRLL
jgi:hypothetical protein